MAEMDKKRKKISSKPTIEELRQYLKIDRHSLDSELEAQPGLYDQVSEAAALSRSRMDLAKDNIDVVESDISSEIRATAEKEGDRLTEKAIDAMVTQNKERQKAVREYLRLKRETEELDQLRESFRQRGYMLRELASLFISGYYQQSSVSGSQNRVREDRAEKNSRRMADRRRGRLKE